MKVAENQITFSMGSKFCLKGEACEIRLVKGRQVVIEVNSKLLTLPINELQSMYRMGDLMPSQPKNRISLIRDISPEQREEALFRLDVVQAMIQEGGNAPTDHHRILDAYDSVATKYKENKQTLCFKFPNTRTACRWLKAYQKNNDFYDLVRNPNQTQGKGKKPPFEINELMTNVLWDEVLGRGKSVNQAYYILIEKVSEEYPHLKTPAKATLYQRYNEIDELAKDMVIKGKKVAKQSRYQSTKKFESFYPYQRWEGDGVVAQVGIKCDFTKEYLGIPTVMFIIDAHTRVCMGRSMHFSRKKAETSELAVECFKNAVLPDENGEGPCGLPALLSCDAGSAYVGEAYTTFLALTGVNRVTSIVQEPQKRPFIERFNGTFRQLCLRTMPGYRGMLKLKEPFSVDEGVENAATLTVSEFTEMVDVFIEDYNNAAHSSFIERSPMSVLESYIHDNPALVRLPDFEQLELFRNFSGRIKECTLQRGKGIAVDNRMYNSTELSSIITKIKGVKKNITVFYDELDISKIVVISPISNDYIIVPITDQFVNDAMSKAHYEAIKNASTKNIPVAKHYTSTRSNLIVDKAIERLITEREAVKREAAKKRKKRRDNALDDRGINITDTETLNKVIKDLVENGTPRFEEDDNQQETEASSIECEQSPIKPNLGGHRGEF
jgi:transposase InsO family protein